jgi:hypothetical protein
MLPNKMTKPESIDIQQTAANNTPTIQYDSPSPSLMDSANVFLPIDKFR